MVNTIAGDLEQLNGPAQVSSVGYSSLDGWTEILSFPGGDLPSGNGDYTYVVTGVIGASAWDPKYFPFLVKAEIGLGLKGQVGCFGPFRMNCTLWDFGNNPTGPGMPFCFIIDSTVDASAIGLTTNSLTLKARIDGNLQKARDPMVIPLGKPLFHVLQCTIQVWDRIVMSGNDSILKTTQVNRLTTGFTPAQGTAWDAIGITDGVAFGATGEDWLLFHSFVYEPSGSPQGASFTGHATHFYAEAVPTTGGNRDLFGNAQTVGRTPSGLGFHGLGPRGWGLGANGAFFNDHHCLYQFGGFSLYMNVPDAFKVHVFMRVEHDNTAASGKQGMFSHIYRWRIFGVRLSKLSFVHAFDRDTLQTGSAQLNYPYWNQRRRAFIEREFANSDWSSYMMMATTTHRQKLAQGRQPSYLLDILSSNADSDTPVTKSAPVFSRWKEGAPLLAVGRVPTFRPGANKATLELSLWKNQTAPPTRSDGIADDHSWIGWYWETDPENLAFPGQGRGGEVALVPGGEADATSLPTWPVDPTNNWSETPQLELQDMRTPAGYRITWPLFLVPRDQRTWQWRGITNAEMDTMRAFLEDNAETAIKWQGPHDTADRIYALVGPFTFAEIPGGLFNAQVSGIELVYGDNINPRILT